MLNLGNAKTNVLVPSAEALAKAAETMQRWQKEMEDEFPDPADLDQDPDYHDPSPAFRPVLGAVENSVIERQPPGTPSPVGDGFRSLSPLIHRAAPKRKHGFKSPLLTTSTASTSGSSDYVASPLKSNCLEEPVTPARRSTSTVMRTGAMSPPRKALGVTPRRPVGGPSSSKPVFVTPFKAGTRPGDVERPKSEIIRSAVHPEPRLNSTAAGTRIIGGDAHLSPSTWAKRENRATYFDLCESFESCCSDAVYQMLAAKPENRQTLATCGSRPQSYSQIELEAMGM